ncbi:MAG: SsrA-binding protein SmpB [Alphaproteobacteria bacterium]|nr:SsrA-binding protein SmpB [Alphaproteobacteria bacterium]
MATREEAQRFVVQNRKARFEYFIDDHLEAGVVLTGSEVKSLRRGQAALADAWAGEKDGELWLFNSYIAEYTEAKNFNHEPKRPRKLLLKAREREKFVAAIRRDGATLVPLSLYFNERGIAKIDLGLAHGKRKADKRETIKDRDWQRDKARLMRDKG